jgi:hypothetical protein
MSLGRNDPGTETGSHTFARGNREQVEIRIDLRDEVTVIRQQNGHFDQHGPIGKASLSILKSIRVFEVLRARTRLSTMVRPLNNQCICRKRTI